jgi:hypothetical protein
MSSEFDDFGAGLQQDLQPVAPTAANGLPDGPVAPVAPEAPETPAAAGTPNVGQPAALVAPPRGSARPVGFPAEVQTALTGEPDAWTVKQWCRSCHVDVLPVGKGECPRCHKALRLNFKARRHPVNVLRRDAHLEKLVARYQPHTPMVQSTCEMQAGILEQLDTLKPGSTEHARLVQLSQQLFNVLETSLVTREAHRQSDLPGVDQMPMSALELTTDLMKRVAAGETLSERELGQLDVLRHAMRGDVVLPPDKPEVPAHQSQDGAEIVEPGATSRPASDPEASQQAPEPACQYCGRACVGRDHHAYDVLHAQDPEHVEARRKEATQTMLATMRHGSGITRW